VPHHPRGTLVRLRRTIAMDRSHHEPRHKKPKAAPCPSQPPSLALSCRTRPHKENMASTPTAPKGQKRSQSVVADEDTPMAEARAGSPPPSELPDVVEVTRPPAKKAKMTPKRTMQTLAELLVRVEKEYPQHGAQLERAFVRYSRGLSDLYSFLLRIDQVHSKHTLRFAHDLTLLAPGVVFAFLVSAGIVEVSTGVWPLAFTVLADAAGLRGKLAKLGYDPKADPTVLHGMEQERIDMLHALLPNRLRESPEAVPAWARPLALSKFFANSFLTHSEVTSDDTIVMLLRHVVDLGLSTRATQVRYENPRTLPISIDHFLAWRLQRNRPEFGPFYGFGADPLEDDSLINLNLLPSVDESYEDGKKTGFVRRAD